MITGTGPSIMPVLVTPGPPGESARRTWTPRSQSGPGHLTKVLGIPECQWRVYLCFFSQAQSSLALPGLPVWQSLSDDNHPGGGYHCVCLLLQYSCDNSKQKQRTRETLIKGESVGLFKDIHSVARRRISTTTLIHSCIRPHVCATVHASAGNTRANAFAASLVLREGVYVCVYTERACKRERACVCA